MPYAYNYLTDQQKNTLAEIRFNIECDNIKLELQLNSPLGTYWHCILYNKFRSVTTSVKFGKEDLPPIGLNFVDVFLEDLEMLLKNQKSVLEHFYVDCMDGTVEDCAKIFEGLEMILKPIRLIAEGCDFLGTTVAQAMSIVQCFDQSKLWRVRLRWVVDPGNIRRFRKELKGVRIEEDGHFINLLYDNWKHRSTGSEKENPVDSSLSEIVAQTMFETRLTMQLILKHLQFFDIERLRKVNHGIRECVSLMKPTPHIETYSIRYELWEGSGNLRIFIALESGEFKNFEYEERENGVALYDKVGDRKDREVSIPGEDYKAMCLNDMENSLSYQMECMKELIVCYECPGADIEDFANPLDRLDAADLSSRIGDILKRRESPLKIRKFSTGTLSQMEVMEILPAIDSNYLKCIELFFPSPHDSLDEIAIELPFEIDQLSLTDQWKNAEQLISRDLTITTPIQDMNTLHFANLEILLKSLSSEDVFYLKTMPYASEYLTDQQKNSIMGIEFVTRADFIKVILKLTSPLEQYFHTITYIKFDCSFTTFVFGNEESLPIQLNFVDVFLEDLEMLLKHQTPVLSYFHVRCSRGTVEDCVKIGEGLEMILKSKTLRVSECHINGTSVAQAMSLVTYFDQSAPFTVRLIHVVDTENFDSSWNGLSEVKIEDDGQSITFEVANPTVQSINLKKEKSVSDIVARTVLENRLPMQFILRHLQCFDIESLRKVNRGIRKCINHIKPNPHIETYSICFYQRANIDNSRLRIYIKLENGEFKDFEYIKNGENSLHGEESIISFSGTDHKSMCLNDIEKTLNNQVECIKELIIFYKSTRHLSENFDILLDEWGTADLSTRIGNILKRRGSPLKTKKFSMGSSSQMEIMEILSAIDSNSLKTIELLYPSEQQDAIKNFYYTVIEWPFQVDQLSETDQWKNAERLISKSLTLTTPIPEMNILNFVNLEILVKTLSSEDVFYLKANLLKSSKFQKFKISFQESTINESLHTLIGEPYRIVSDIKKNWYFRIGNTNDYIHIVLDTRKNQVGTPKLITLTRVAKEDTPFFELPMNQLVIN